MKTAQGKYHFANNEILLNLYFDPKCFSCILPSPNKDEEEHLLRQICDSIAIAMPKDVSEKRFYIKRAFKIPQANSLTLFCTDGFLMDSTLVIPLQEQPFQTERIKITESTQLPSRFKLDESDKTMQMSLSLFEDNAKKIFSIDNPSIQKELLKPTKQFTSSSEALDKTFDIFSELNHLKKEMIEMSKSRQETLETLMNQVEAKRKQIYDLVMKEAQANFSYEENKIKLKEFAEKSISTYCSEFIKETAASKQKLESIARMPSQFDNETQAGHLLITQKLNHMNQFKELLIQKLYQCAQDYQKELSKEWLHTSLQSKQISIQEFNRKFSDIAFLSESYELNDYQITLDRLIPLSLEQLQTIISSEDKDKLGLLQKCNTSWTEESKELKIVLQHLSQLNALYRKFFQQDPLYDRYTKGDMIQMMRIPFPRSFQFKFSNLAFDYKKSLDDFYRSQKEIISHTAQTNKKTMQIADTLHKTKLAMVDAEKVSESIRLTVASYKKLLEHKEESGEIIKVATKEFEKTEKMKVAMQTFQLLLKDPILTTMKIFRRKIETRIAELEAHALEAQKETTKMNDIKMQIDLMMKDATTQSIIQNRIKQIESQTNTMQISLERLQEINIVMHDFELSLSRYQETIHNHEQLIAYTAEAIQKQQQEAKSLVSKVIRQSSSGENISEHRKQQMVNLFSQIDTNASQIERQQKDALNVQNQLLEQLNNKKSDLSDEAFDHILLALKEKILAIETKKKQITAYLEQIKSLV